MEKLQEKGICKPIDLCSTPPEAEDYIEKEYKIPPRYCVRLAYMWDGEERVIVAQYNHLREIRATMRYWRSYLHVLSIVTYKRLDL